MRLSVRSRTSEQRLQNRFASFLPQIQPELPTERLRIAHGAGTTCLEASLTTGIEEYAMNVNRSGVDLR
jgi:hypothetical protein